MVTLTHGGIDDEERAVTALPIRSDGNVRFNFET
jgi:hypothetical protein